MPINNQRRWMLITVAIRKAGPIRARKVDCDADYGSILDNKTSITVGHRAALFAAMASQLGRPVLIWSGVFPDGDAMNLR